MTDHLSLDELAELDEGLLAPERISTARAHLHGCETCRARTEALATTRSMLSDLPAVPMPQDVTARIDRALADEAVGEQTVGEQTVDEAQSAAAAPLPLARASEESDGPPDTRSARPADVVPPPGSVARRRLGRPTLPGAAVAAAIVLAVGAIVVGAINHHGTNAPTESAGASSGSVPLSNTGGGVIAQTQPRNFIKTSTGQDYTPATLAQQVQRLIASSNDSTFGAAASPSPATKHRAAVAGRPTTDRKQARKPDKTAPTDSAALGSATQANNQPIPATLRPLASSRAKILSCAAALTGDGDAVPLAVDFGTYHGGPAAVFVFKSPDPSKVAVFVMVPPCDNGSFKVFENVPVPN